MTNVVRKTLARMANRVLDEVFRTQLCSAQQAFNSSGDITRHLVMLHTMLRDYQYLFPHDLLVLLSLDCSKAYNRVGWSWLRRCLAASRLPENLQRLLLAFLPGTAHLVFRGTETAGVNFLSGLAHGCPRSCFLYIFVIDPLPHKIKQHPGVSHLSVFADDWTIVYKGLLPLFSLRPIIRDFEIASGQEINMPKSGIIPSRQLSRAETLS